MFGEIKFIYKSSATDALWQTLLMYIVTCMGHVA